MKTPDAPGPLAAFIRSHRERLTPEQAGLPSGSRRRAKGLRREEVAALCGISPTWLTWIEQGRTQSVSATTLAALAQALQLTRAERDYLYTLAGQKNPDEHAPAATPQAQESLAQATGHINTPAYVLDALWFVPAWNTPAATLFGNWLATPGPDKNLLHFMFLTAEARQLVENWAMRAQRMVAEFRAEISARREDDTVQRFISALRRHSPDFDQLWQQQDVLGREGGERSFNHPQQGRISYQQLTLRLASAPELKLVMLL